MRRPDALPKGREGVLSTTTAFGFFFDCISDDSLPIFLPAAPGDSRGEPRALREPFCPSTYSISRCLRCALCTEPLPAAISPCCHASCCTLPITSERLTV